MKTNTITYTVTALAQWQIDSNGTQSDAVIKGSAATLPAAKRKARQDAADYQNKAVITYYEDGTEIYSEINRYGLCGKWTENI